MKDKILSYLKAGYPGIILVTHEEQRAEAEVLAAAKHLKFKILAWSLCTGLMEIPTDGNGTGRLIPDTNDPIPMLEEVAKREKSVVLLRDFHAQLDDRNAVLGRKLREVMQGAKEQNLCLVLVGCRLVLPPELEKEMVVVEFALPDRLQLAEVLDALAFTNSDFKLPAEGDVREAVLDAACGLTTTEAEGVFALSVAECGEVRASIVAREKAATVKKNGILEIVEVKQKLEDIGGLTELKGWLTKRRRAFGKEARAYGLPMPKGFLMLGIPGCGKSLTAKATAAILGVPLLKLDAGKLFGSLVGQSEQNLRTAIQTAEAVAPCVLWIDELEKAFAGSKSSGSTDGGTTSRVFGGMLQWLQEKVAPVFVVATANDVSSLPPELLRKGRFDENWFLDLPTETEREEIWAIQIRRHGRDPAKFTPKVLAGATDGWTGAEIESLFGEAMFSAFDDNIEPNDTLIQVLAGQTVPLSKMMQREIEGLREWSKSRAKNASAPVAAKGFSPKSRKMVAGGASGGTN